MPWFVIFSMLISSVVTGLVFNSDFKINNSDDQFVRLEIKIPEAQADTATTSVTVRNAPPYFTVDPAENPGSTSTSPVNASGSIPFIGTADDDESNDYYLAICGTDSITASSTGGPPSCAVGQEFCISSLASSTVQNTCTYSDVPSYIGETDEWYAFVCDNHQGEADCSGSSQGQSPGDYATSSPFYINHAPTLDTFFTSIDNVAPGGVFEFTSTSSDNDVSRSGDEIYLDICDNSGWATTTGCAGTQYCSGTSTPAVGAVSISCTFTDTAPTADAVYTVYGYIEDEFSLPASSGNGTTTTYTVINVAPTVSNIILQSGDSIQPNLKGASEVSASTTSASLADNNGCSDIVSATSSIYWSNATNLENCSPDDNDCYQIASSSCALVGGSCTGPSDFDAEYICTTTIAFHAQPTDGLGNPASTTDWLAGITAFDEALSGVATTSTSSAVNLISATALEVTESGIAYNTIVAGFDTGTVSATTTVVNYGNTPLDAGLVGTDMTKAPDVIPVANQEYDLTYGFAWGTGTDLASTTTTTLNTLTARPTSQTDISDYVYWGIGIPVGTPSGDYEGTNTFVATLDDDAW